MANKQMTRVKELATSELSAAVKGVQEQLFHARMQKATGELKDTAQMWRLRKELARIRTAQGHHGKVAR